MARFCIHFEGRAERIYWWISCGVGKKESRMTLKFLAWATGSMELTINQDKENLGYGGRAFEGRIGISVLNMLWLRRLRHLGVR